MSGAEWLRTTSLPHLKSEKPMLTELLILYKNSPCLWDQKHKLYRNVDASESAYIAILEIYRTKYPTATLPEVKKKIEHMRSAYRREYKRVVVAYLNGRTHRPMLWYYDLLSFLNDNTGSKVKMLNAQETLEIIDSDEDSVPLKRKKVESESNVKMIKVETESNEKIQKVETETNDDNLNVSEYLNYSESEDLLKYQEENDPQGCPESEPEAFGRTVGLQLKELNRMQRIFAEKLISDVIFQGRLGNLTVESCLNLESTNDNDVSSE